MYGVFLLVCSYFTVFIKKKKNADIASTCRKQLLLHAVSLTSSAYSNSLRISFWKKVNVFLLQCSISAFETFEILSSFVYIWKNHQSPMKYVLCCIIPYPWYSPTLPSNVYTTFLAVSAAVWKLLHHWAVLVSSHS